MKKLFKLVTCCTALAMLLAFSACGGTEDAGSQEEASEPIVVELGEGLPSIDLDSAYYAEAEIPDYFADYGCYAFYEDNRGYCDVALYQYDNPDGQTLEEFVTDFADEYHGCIESIEFGDCQGYSVPDYYEDEHGRDMINAYFFESDDGFVELSYWYNVKEVEIGDTGYYFWMPVVYEEGTLSEDEVAVNGVSTYIPDEENTAWLPEIFTYVSSFSGWTYEAMVQDYYVDYLGLDINLTEEDFDELIDDGFTLEELNQFYEAVHPLDDQMIITNDNGIEIGMCQYDASLDGVDTTVLNVDIIDDNTLIEISLHKADGSWLGHGEAFAYSIHKGAVE